jgi:excisionase family DNA binding protein
MLVDEVAAYLKVHPRTVYKLVKRKDLPCFRVGSELRFRKTDVDQWIASEEQATFEKSWAPTYTGDSPETSTTVKIGAISSGARCTEVGVRTWGRFLLIYADAGGRSMNNLVFCHGHGRLRVERDRAARLDIYDDRMLDKSL